MADECAGKDTDERKATCEPAVPLGGDTLGHVEYVRAAELRIRAGVRKAFQAFVNNKLWEDYRLTASADNLYVMSLEESSNHHGRWEPLAATWSHSRPRVGRAVRVPHP